MSSNKDDRRALAFGREAPSEFYSGHFTELDVEDKAAELWMLRVRQKRFCRVIGNWLKSGRAQ